MDSATVKEKLIEVLGQIQADSELDCPSLTGKTRPTQDLPKFDSKVWPVATSILAAAIDVTIPNDVNIFFDDTTKQPRSIDQTATFVCNLVNKERAAA